MPRPQPDEPEKFEIPLSASETDSSSRDEIVMGYPETLPSLLRKKQAPTLGRDEPASKPTPMAAPQNLSSLSTSPFPVRTGPPLPKRPKGRLFIGTMMLSVVIGFCYIVLNATIRYKAYGQVIARRIELPVPWPGVVQSIHVRDGDHVNAGQVVARVDSLEMRQKIDEIEDALRLERAQLSSDLAMLRWEAEKIRDSRKLSLSEFYDKWSQLLWEQSRLADLQTQVKRTEPMVREGVASAEKLESLRIQVAGQKRRVQQLTEAVRALKHRSDQSPIELAMEDRAKPTLTRVENLQAELLRTRTLIQQGEIRAPASGYIVRTHRFVGEYADYTTPVAELVIDGSTELLLYVRQPDIKNYEVGTNVTVNIKPTNQNVTCDVHRIAIETCEAPDSLSRHYGADEMLFPVYLKFSNAEALSHWLAVGSEVRLPRGVNTISWPNLQAWWHADSAVVSTAQTEPKSSVPTPFAMNIACANKLAAGSVPIVHALQSFWASPTVDARQTETTRKSTQP